MVNIIYVDQLKLFNPFPIQVSINTLYTWCYYIEKGLKF